MKKKLIHLAQNLIKINSCNPSSNERKISLFIRDYLNKSGLKSKIYEFKKDRLNVVCTIQSQRSKKKILITPHTDTVPATGIWKYPPFSGKLIKGKIYGRGATDCKSNVAVLLYVIERLKQDKISLKNLDLVCAFCADEETGSNFGIRPLVKRLKGIDYGIVLDSNEFNIIVAQKGLLHLRVDVFGKEAHGAYPERGINAIENSIYALADILKKKFYFKPHRLLKKPTLNIGRIGGGDKVNIVAAQAFFELDIRFLPSMEKAKIIRAVKKTVDKYTNKYKIKVLAQQDPIEVNRRSFLIKALKSTLKKHRIKPELKPCFGATVINFLEQQNIKAFAFGFGSKGCAHTKNEYVRVSNLYKGVQVLKDYLLSLDKYIEKNPTL